MTELNPLTANKPWFAAWPRGLPHRIHVPETPIDHCLSVAAERYPNKPALIFMDREWTYAQLSAQVDAVAGHLQQVAQVQAGDRVLLMSQNCPQFVAAFLAILRCGAVVVPINPMCTATELEHYLNDSGAEVALVAQDMLPAMQPAFDDRRLRHGVVHVYSEAMAADTDLVLPQGMEAPAAVLSDERLARWSDVIAASLPVEHRTTQPNELCLLPYTSGTTGRAKGCMHTHRSVQAATTASVLWRNLHAESVVLGAAPLFHLLGLQNAMLIPLASAATVVLLPRWHAGNAVRLIERYRVSVWAAPPAMLSDFFAHPEAQTRDLSSLSVLAGGGAAMPEAVSTILRTRFQIDYIEGYGMTETAAFLLCNPMHRTKPQCLGIPSFGVDVRIVDPETQSEVAAGEVGELLVSGNQVMQGYWRNEAANAEAFRVIEGRRYLRTGDLARIDADGYLFMSDRLKRMINVSGYKVWPAELECTLHEHPAIQEACVVAAPDARQGESVRAVIALRAGAELTAEDFIAWCRERLAAYKVPRIVEFRSALPRSSTGKIAWREIQMELNPTTDPVSKDSHA
ncbi:long-chain-fatty-acid--CoA ligase [Hydrogenophaga sp.]|uniref:long-chain-fatty-acid--CoA ligase n=1 Tax=Hydrogenophaga sp. TaxID=1904254 RepID=UPI0035AFB05F